MNKGAIKGRELIYFICVILILEDGLNEERC